MQISSLGVQLSSTPDAPVYTWQQTWWFFVVGLARAAWYALIPIGITLWHNYQNYDDPIDWALVRWLALGAVGPVALTYWIEHRALLKTPPLFDIPPEFRPTIKQTEHTVTTTDKHTEIMPAKPTNET